MIKNKIVFNLDILIKPRPKIPRVQSETVRSSSSLRLQDLEEGDNDDVDLEEE